MCREGEYILIHHNHKYKASKITCYLGNNFVNYGMSKYWNIQLMITETLKYKDAPRHPQLI